jgi:hypothetical protein
MPPPATTSQCKPSGVVLPPPPGSTSQFEQSEVVPPTLPPPAHTAHPDIVAGPANPDGELLAREDRHGLGHGTATPTDASESSLPATILVPPWPPATAISTAEAPSGTV